MEAISLSRRSIVCRIDAITANIQDQLLTSNDDFRWLSIALDKITDLEDFEITEEMLTMEYLKGTYTGKDMYNNVIRLTKSKLRLDKLVL